MTGLIANVLLNILLVGLLCATIGYCYVLNRRIKTLQDSKSELANLLKHFDQSTIKASETIIAMQTASKKIGDNIQMRIDKANYLMDDLAYSIDKGTKLTQQLEAAFAINRARSRIHEEPQEDVLDLHHFTADEEPVRPVDKAPKAPPKRSPASIEDIVEKVVSRSNKSSATHSGAPTRSRAEQELIELIRSSKGSA
jgi:septal ring factor EnvC (AmiA/AmiB activator)